MISMARSTPAQKPRGLASRIAPGWGSVVPSYMVSAGAYGFGVPEASFGTSVPGACQPGKGLLATVRVPPHRGERCRRNGAYVEIARHRDDIRSLRRHQPPVLRRVGTRRLHSPRSFARRALRFGFGDSRLAHKFFLKARAPFASLRPMGNDLRQTFRFMLTMLSAFIAGWVAILLLFRARW